MKYVIVLADGMADRPIAELGGQTPMEAAATPVWDELAKRGEVGLVRTVPEGMAPGSDTANLSVMGYEPEIYHTGRSPLEAASMGVELSDSDITFRCNLVTLHGHGPYGEKKMMDHSAGEISTGEAKILIEALRRELETQELKLYPGVSYRHLLVWRGALSAEAAEGAFGSLVLPGKSGAAGESDAAVGTISSSAPVSLNNCSFTPPHDILDKPVAAYLPRGPYGKLFLELQEASVRILEAHPVNQRRKVRGLNPANSAWFWGEGRKPRLNLFREKYGPEGAVISAVDLINGIGVLAGLKPIHVEGATGTIHTNFDGKAAAALKALKEDGDYIYIHLEAPDECSHQGDLKGKVRSIELIDEKIVGPIQQELERRGEDYRMLILPDHPTPLALRTHVADPVPWLIYDSRYVSQEEDREASRAAARTGSFPFSEKGAAASSRFYPSGPELMSYFMASGNSDTPIF